MTKNQKVWSPQRNVTGVIKSVRKDGSCTILWDDGRENNYAAGAEGKTFALVQGGTATTPPLAVKKAAKPKPAKKQAPAKKKAPAKQAKKKAAKKTAKKK